MKHPCAVRREGRLAHLCDTGKIGDICGGFSDASAQTPVVAHQSAAETGVMRLYSATVSSSLTLLGSLTALAALRHGATLSGL